MLTCGSCPPFPSDGVSEVQKRRRAFERESSNIQLLSSPGMAFGLSSQRGVGSGRSQEQPRPSQRHRHEEVLVCWWYHLVQVISYVVDLWGIRAC